MFEPPSAEAPYVELATAESLCGTRNVQMSPDGGRLTLAYENSFGPLSLNLGYVIVADTDCLFQKAACNLWKIGAVSSVRYPQWSSVDRSLFVVGGDARSRPAWAIKYSTKEGANGLELTLAEKHKFSAGGYALSFAGSVPWRTAAELAAAVDAAAVSPQSEYLPLSLSWRGGVFLGALVEGKSDLRITAPLADTEEKEPIYRPDGQRFALRAKADTRADVVVDDRLPRRGLSIKSFGSRAVKDASTGSVVGEHGQQWLELPGAPRLSKQIERALLEHPDAQIVSATALGPHGPAILLMKTVAGETVLLRAGPGERAESVRLKCGAPAAEGLEVAVEDWGDAAWPLPVLHYSRAGNKRLVIYFHGGPAASSLNSDTPAIVQALLEGGADVAVVEYSGSTGDLALTRRLGDNGFLALEKDAAFVAAKTRQQASEYASIHLYGESYGGAYVVAVSNACTACFTSTALISPWLRYAPPPADWPEARRVYQVKFENRIFGWKDEDRKRAFTTALRSEVDRWRPQGRTYMAFSDNDHVAQPEWLGALAATKGITPRILPKLGHDISGYPPIVQDISAVILGQLEPPPN